MVYYPQDLAHIVPSGSIYASKDVRKGVLPQILNELLETRAMIKRCMKAYKAKDKMKGKGSAVTSNSVYRTLEAKQLALKYIANVTYGYTSATYSGRCCCPLVADSIVELGRRTLSRAWDLASELGEEGKWEGARVVYSDTDSVFIELPGRSVSEAFEFGKEFCDKVTEMNPAPVHLKLEKVYGSCMLQTKKKYCGMMFTSPNQRVGVFEAKVRGRKKKKKSEQAKQVQRRFFFFFFFFFFCVSL